jgi:hypothetical protein
LVPTSQRERTTDCTGQRCTTAHGLPACSPHRAARPCSAPSGRVPRHRRPLHIAATGAPPHQASQFAATLQGPRLGRRPCPSGSLSHVATIQEHDRPRLAGLFATSSRAAMFRALRPRAASPETAAHRRYRCATVPASPRNHAARAALRAPPVPLAGRFLLCAWRLSSQR